MRRKDDELTKNQRIALTVAAIVYVAFVLFAAYKVLISILEVIAP
ncbi:MAG: hypothetical protein WBC07_08365 [Methylotenera sp.]